MSSNSMLPPNRFATRADGRQPYVAEALRYTYHVFARFVLFCALAIAARAADLSGIWSGQMIDRNGDAGDLSFRFSQSGETVTGKMYGDNESTPVTDITIAGDQIAFSVTGELNGQITKFLYSGTVKGDEIQMVRERAVTKTDPAKTDPAKPDAAKPNPKQTFTLKRLS
jgi:hypothetical protein